MILLCSHVQRGEAILGLNVHHCLVLHKDFHNLLLSSCNTSQEYHKLICISSKFSSDFISQTNFKSYQACIFSINLPKEAIWRAVLPFLVAASTFAPRCSSSVTTLTCPSLLARCRALRPF